ncbi:MAG: hypothetical protein WDN28_09390 [Chthoniobacter sp.]
MQTSNLSPLHRRELLRLLGFGGFAALVGGRAAAAQPAVSAPAAPALNPAAGYYRFRFGDATAYVLSDGYMDMPTQPILATEAEPAAVAKTLAAHFQKPDGQFPFQCPAPASRQRVGALRLGGGWIFRAVRGPIAARDGRRRRKAGTDHRALHLARASRSRWAGWSTPRRSNCSSRKRSISFTSASSIIGPRRRPM